MRLRRASPSGRLDRDHRPTLAIRGPLARPFEGFSETRGRLRLVAPFDERALLQAALTVLGRRHAFPALEGTPEIRKIGVAECVRHLFDAQAAHFEVFESECASHVFE